MIKIMVGGQLDKAKVLEEIKKYPSEGISAEIKSDFEAAIAVKNGEADYYFGSCATGAGGSLAGAIAMLGYDKCTTVSMPGISPDYNKIENYVKDGKKAFGFTNNHIETAVSYLLKAIIDNL